MRGRWVGLAGVRTRAGQGRACGRRGRWGDRRFRARGLEVTGLEEAGRARVDGGSLFSPTELGVSIQCACSKLAHLVSTVTQ